MTRSTLVYRPSMPPMRSDMTLMPNSVLRSLSVVRGLLVNNQPLYGYLEPGDATRYTIAIQPIEEAGDQNALLLTRMGGSEPAGTAILWNWQDPEEVSDFGLLCAAKVLGRGNEWSQMLFKWWLEELINA